MPGALIEAVDVSKSFGEIRALDSVSLTCNVGEMVGLLGPNGSGKTTLMRIMMGLELRDSGKVSIDGIDPGVNPIAARKLIGYVPETVALYESLTPKEYFQFVSAVRGINREKYVKKVETLSSAFGLTDRLEDFTGTLSRGNRQKVAIIGAILHDPKIILLDEAITGLDPYSAAIFRELLRESLERGSTVLFSTHILEVAEAICNRVIILAKGKKAAEGNVAELRSLVAAAASLEEVFMKLTGEEEELGKVISALRGAER